ncbi:GAF domain-containing sensor histidine kinase [Nocardia sp. NPDC005366]|uniref:GAF domain-containing sensor histidine kinase n=1 Tax=Nocardia sp. NPDC005366 TaxID=3156878 RepID=UPI0033B0317A
MAFRDVNDELHRSRRVAAVVRAAASLETPQSASKTLDALAEEILRKDSVAAVQILTAGQSNRGLRVMGSAGFPHWPDFPERLLECEARGATVAMFDAMDSGRPTVVRRRWSIIRSDPAWEPLYDYLSERKWDSFAAVPLPVRRQVKGTINVFFAPGRSVTATTLDFLDLMAEQAAVAIEDMALLDSVREGVRREERQRLARDLHDSIVQQVFSISMQAKSLTLIAERSESVPARSVTRVADDIGLLSQTVLTDLRAMVHELRPISAIERGSLEEAVRTLAESTRNRTGMRLDIVVGSGLDRIPGAVADDVYRIVAEAIHNVVKHADAGRVTVRLVVRQATLRGSVTDDGCGLAADSGTGVGLGMRTMRERAAHWGGTLTVKQRRHAGTIVGFAVPLDAHITIATETTEARTGAGAVTNTAERRDER